VGRVREGQPTHIDVVAMLTKNVLVAGFVAILSIGDVCTGQETRNEALVKRIQSEVTPGMLRSQVDETLAQLPLSYVYVPRKDLEAIGEAKNGDVRLGGRFDVVTNYEQRGVATMTRSYLFIDLDEQERVVEVRVQSLTMGPGF